MLNFDKTAAQGEIYIRRIDAIPSDAEPFKSENGKFVIGHSESGHNHTMLMEHAVVSRAKNAPAGMTVLYALLDGPNALIHERGYDTHEPIALQPGMYEFRSGREFDHYEALARKQAD
jgi:hypothetical protein